MEVLEYMQLPLLARPWKKIPLPAPEKPAIGAIVRGATVPKTVAMGDDLLAIGLLVRVGRLSLLTRWPILAASAGALAGTVSPTCLGA